MSSHHPAEIDSDPPLSHRPAMLATNSDQSLDRITGLAAQFFAVPVACVVIDDSNQGWTRSCVGSDIASSVEQLISHALGILPRDLVVVPDLLDDPHFATHPAVRDEPHARFYAAAPVHSADGVGIGVLSLLDQKPRQFSADQVARLADFAKLIDNELAAVQSRRSWFQQNDSERCIRELLDHLPEGVLLLDGEGTIVSCNAVAERMYGAAGRGLAGVHSSDLTADDPQRLGDLLAAGVLDQIQALARRVDGSAFPVEFSIKILGADSARSYALIVRDISARKEEERRAQFAEARRRSYFVTATHELRTPMASVLGFSELLLQRDFEPAEGRELLEIVHRQATRLVSLINEMLDLARIESGGREGLDMRAVDAATIVAATLSGLSGLGADHRVHTRIAANLPPISADADKLQRALTNIISNAVKYSDPSSDIAIAVFETTLDARAAVGFQVADRGIGMTLDEQRHIYEPFFRASAKSEAPGTGLGMTIFKEIIDLHGGLVEIESAPGSGTTVTFVLPAMPADD
jgi:PAS domain S-box-containing protein